MSFKQNVKYMMKYYFFIFETCDVVEIEIKIEYKNDLSVFSSMYSICGVGGFVFGCVQHVIDKQQLALVQKKVVFVRAPEIDGLNSTSYGDYLPLKDTVC